MAGRYWRQAASLIVVGEASSPIHEGVRKAIHRTSQKSDIIYKNKKFKLLRGCMNYKSLFLKRAVASAFMPGAYVFPGGAIDKADFHPSWLSHFKQHGYSKEQLIKLFRFPNNDVELYSNNQGETVPELAFRICALRETFEETGLLLASTNASSNSFSSVFRLHECELKKWRTRVHNDASEFLNLMRHINGIPSVFSLFEWVSWLTPTIFKGLKQRFDTAFYITFMDSEIPLDLLHNTAEAEEICSCSPMEILESYLDGKVKLMPPQLYEILRLINFNESSHLKAFSEGRSRTGMARLFPVTIFTQDGYIGVLPGDELYPESPDVYGLHEPLKMDNQTIEDLRSGSKLLHRMEFPVQNKPQVYVNVQMEKGQISPIGLAV